MSMLQKRRKQHWLRHTGCVYEKDRGILGRDKSRMDLQFEFGFRFSQEGPVLFSQRYQSKSDQGWSTVLGSAVLDTCRMHQLTWNSSIRIFIFLVLTMATPLLGRATGSPKAEDQITKVANQFEAIMLSKMYSDMQSGNIVELSEDNPFRRTYAENVYQGWLNEQMINEMSKSRPLKIGDLVEDELRGKIGIGRSNLVK